MSSKRPQKSPKGGLTPEQRFRLDEKTIDNKRQIINFIGSGGLLVALAVPILAARPLAETLAGKETVLNVSIALGISIAMTGVAGVIGVISHSRGKRNTELENRNRELSRRVHVLRARLRSNKLPDTVSPEELESVNSEG